MGRERWEEGKGIMNKNPVAWIGVGRGHRAEEGGANGKVRTLRGTGVTNGQEQNRDWKENLTF